MQISLYDNADSAVAVGQFQSEIVPILQSNPNPHEMERYIQNEMEQGTVFNSV